MDADSDAWVTRRADPSGLILETCISDDQYPPDHDGLLGWTTRLAIEDAAGGCIGKEVRRLAESRLQVA
jgi:hypothetical protein